MKISCKTILYLLLLTGNISISAGQFSQTKIQELKVGDRCPDFEFKGMINYPKANAKLSDFKGKFVIIDFWATWCSACIKGMSELNPIQNKFGNDLVIIPVTYESKEAIKKFLSRNDLLRNTKLFIATSNTILNQYFIHREIPHEVIIDRNGIVK